MSFMDKMRDLVGIDYEGDEDFDDITQEEIENYKKSMGSSASPAPAEESSSNIRPLGFGGVEPPMTAMPKAAPDMKDSMNQSGQFKMVVIEPKSLDECRKLVDNLRARKPVIINLESSTSSAVLLMLCPEPFRESTRIYTSSLLRT